MKTAVVVIALALAVSSLTAFGQDAGGPPPAGQAGGPGHKPGGFHVLPPRAMEQLNLTADQQKQIADLEAEVKAKMEKILTPDQLNQLKQLRPPPPRDGNGPAAGGTAGGENKGKGERPE